MIDLFCPIGFGTRGLIVAPPKAGKTTLLRDIATSVAVNHPQVRIIAVLIDERPEEVTEFTRHVPGEVLASSNDMDLETHTDLALFAYARRGDCLKLGKTFCSWWIRSPDWAERSTTIAGTPLADEPCRVASTPWPSTGPNESSGRPGTSKARDRSPCWPRVWSTRVDEVIR